MNRTVASLVALLAFAGHTIAQTTSSGGGDHWEITYFVSGSTTGDQPWIDPNDNSLKHRSFDADLSNDPGGQTDAPQRGGSANSVYYTPTGSSSGYWVGCHVKTAMTVRTRVQWVSSGNAPAPSEVKLALHGYAAAMDPTPEGRDANDGLGHTPLEAPQGYGRTVKYTGTRYRAFKVGSDGKVEFSTSLSAGIAISGSGNGNETCQFSVAPTDWAVRVTSDRDGTFRRVVRPDGSVWRVPNSLEDDGVTARGGDGQGYGDAVATEPYQLNGNERDFASTFTLSILGEWGPYGPQASLTSAADLRGLGGPGATSLVGGYEHIDDSDAKPLKQFAVVGSASSPDVGISDTYTYNMNVHLKAQKEEAFATFTKDYLYWANQDPSFTDYHSASWTPQRILSWENPDPTSAKVTYSTGNTVTSASGWEYTATQGAELDPKIVKIIFNAQFQTSGSTSAAMTATVNGSTDVPAGYRPEIWSCPLGTLTKYRSSRWDDHGYASDAFEYVLSGFGPDILPLKRLTTGPSPIPHLGDHN